MIILPTDLFRRVLISRKESKGKEEAYQRILLIPDSNNSNESDESDDESIA